MKSWSQDRILELIQLYKEQPVLWNVQHKDYRNNDKKNAVWSEIAEVMGIKDVEKKMNILNVQFRREVKKIHDRKQAGNPPDTISSKWFAFEAMSFLKGKTRRSKQSNINTDETTCSPNKPKKRPWKPVTSDVNHSIENVIDFCDQSLTTRNSVNIERDEYSAFGDIVAIKLRKLPSSCAKNKAMNMITDFLFQIELECSESEHTETVYIKTYDINDE